MAFWFECGFWDFEIKIEDFEIKIGRRKSKKKRLKKRFFKFIISKQERKNVR